MRYPLPSVDLSTCQPVNYLWPQFIGKLGLEKANKAVHQALDLQRMQGKKETLPVLLTETCGLALVNTDLLHSQTGIPCRRDGLILLLSTRNHVIQLLSEF